MSSFFRMHPANGVGEHLDAFFDGAVGTEGSVEGGDSAPPPMIGLGSYGHRRRRRECFYEDGVTPVGVES